MQQFADDTNLFISDTRSVTYILALVHIIFEKVFGASLNKDTPLGCGWDAGEGVQKDRVV